MAPLVALEALVLVLVLVFSSSLSEDEASFTLVGPPFCVDDIINVSRFGVINLLLIWLTLLEASPELDMFPEGVSKPESIFFCETLAEPLFRFCPVSGRFGVTFEPVELSPEALFALRDVV